jgi:hypothetical protein
MKKPKGIEQKGGDMKSLRITGITGAVAIVTLLGMSGAVGAGAATNNAPSHSVTLYAAAAKKKTVVCYKGTAVRHVTAVNAHCPAGWTTKKPATAKATAFSGTYHGTIAMLWSSSAVNVTALTGTGTGTDLGLTAVTGTGSSNPSGSCDPISGLGILTGGGSTLHLKLATSSKGCAADSAAPTTVVITGTATVVSGTGKFAGTTGTLKVSGSFQIKSTAAGSNESDAFSATLTGSLKVK